MERLNANLIMKSLGFHGQPLQKVWEGERGENDLIKNGITNPDYSVYRIRQKTLTFQDRAKRLKLHQFLAKKADFLYDNSLVNDNVMNIKNFEHDKTTIESIKHLPYYEYFLNIDKNKRQRYFFETCQAGDLVYGSLINKIAGGFAIKVHCSIGVSPKYLTDLNVKAFLPHSLALPLPEKKTRQLPATIDYVLCEIVEVVPDTDKMIVTMKGEKEDVKYGIVKFEDFPEVYKQLTNSSEATYDTLLESSSGFNNPYCFEVLEEQLGLSSFEYYTNMSGLRGRFPQQEYSNELRQVQASKWAFRSVAEGIEHFKEGRHPEAFQCLNKALSIDPRNVEGLVARGALYANSGSFKKAVEDFETALKLNPSHANARKYMGETLVALGRSYEEDNKIEEARKAYQDCLAIIPHHEEAQNSLDFLKSRNIGKQFIEPGELQLPTLNITKLDQNKLNEASTSGSNKRSDLLDEKKSKKIKKKKSRGSSKKERRSTSSSSESDSSDSSDSSSDTSSSTDSSSTTDSEVNSHSKKKRQRKRQKSMSPLSKRIILMNESGDGNNFPNQIGGDSNHDSGLDDYELKVRKFLEMTRDEDDYEEKVRRFVEEASKYRKERKILEEKAKKKKRKEAKKLKKESKKRRREKDREERKKAKINKKMESKLDLDAIENKKIREALKLFENFPVLDEIGNKLSSLLEKSNASLDNEKSEKNSRNVTDGLYESFMEEQSSGGKWKMAFSKEKGKKQEPHTQASSSKSIPKQYAFTNESETDDERDASLGAPVQHPPPPPPANTDKMRKRNHSPRSKYLESSQPSKSVVKSGPVVLDKFGNFRLANMEANKPPEPPGSPKRTSRSRSRSRPVRKYSSSRSRSRSQRKRSRSGSYVRKYSRSRSRSRSFRSRTRSRTPRSRSYSRSRSRSRSVRRYGGDRRNFRGRGGYNERGTYYKPRFSNNTRGRGGRGNYRDYRDYRGGRDRGRPFRPRAARGGNRYYRYRDGSRERRYSRDRSEDRDRRSYSNEHGRQEAGSDGEPKKTQPSSPGPSHRRDEASKNSPDVEGRWAEKSKPDHQNDRKSIDRQDVSLEDMEKFISKAKKESKDDMIERNKDILKKSSNSAW